MEAASRHLKEAFMKTEAIQAEVKVGLALEKEKRKSEVERLKYNWSR